jgi:hypothetical protein
MTAVVDGSGGHREDSGATAMLVAPERDDGIRVEHPPGVPEGRTLRRDRAPMAIIVAALVMQIPLVFNGITYRGNGWRQADTAAIARNWARGSFNPFMPRINWGGAGKGFVETEFQILPATVAALWRVTGVHLWIARLVALFMTAAALVGFWRLSERLLGRRGRLVALTVFAFAPITIRFGSAIMPEAPMMALLVWTLWWFLRWLDTGKWTDAIATGIFAMGTVLAKPTALHIGITFAAMIALRHGWRGLFRPQSLVVAAITVVPNIAWMLWARSLYLDHGNTFGVLSGGDQKWGSLSMITDPITYANLAAFDALLVFAVVGAPVFVAGLALALHRRQWFVPVGTLAVLTMFVGTLRYTSSRGGAQYHIHLLVFGALGIGIAADWVGQVLGRRRARAAIGVFLVAFLAAGSVAYADQFRPWHEQRLACSHAVGEIIPDGDLVVVGSDSNAIAGGFPNNYQDPFVFYHADVKGWSLARDHHTLSEIEALVAQGARWYIQPDASVFDTTGTFAADMGQRYRQVDTGTPNCSLFALDG